MKRALGAVLFGCVAVSAGCGSRQPAGPADSSVQRLTAASAAPTTAPSVASASAAPVSHDRQDPAVAVSSSPATPYSDSRVIARINGEPVTMGELLKPLIESHGLQILTGLVQLDVLKQEARRDHTVVTADDIRREREETLGKMFKDADAKEQDQLDAAEEKKDTATAEKLRTQIDADREALLVEYLENQHFSRAEFDLKIEMNAYLRKKAERLLQGKITDEMVEKEFGVEYGETYDISILQLPNMQQVAEARQRLANGENFNKVAAALSVNKQLAAVDGRMPGISRQTDGLPKTFRDTVVSLEPGQISETLNLNGYYWILKLDAKHPPKAVKFENVKDSLRKSMFDRLVGALIGKLYEGIGHEVVQGLQIEDPMLKKQYDQLMARQQQQSQDRQKMDRIWQKERPQSADPASAQPAAPSAAAAPKPAAAPATQP